MRLPFKPFATDRRGATAIEYSLIASGIAGLIVATLATLGSSLQQMWDTIATALN